MAISSLLAVPGPPEAGFTRRVALKQDWAGPVLDELRRHGLEPGPEDTPASLRERLNEVYLVGIRALKARLLAGEFPAAEYADRVRSLKEDHPLLGVPLDRWKR